MTPSPNIHFFDYGLNPYRREQQTPAYAAPETHDALHGCPHLRHRHDENCYLLFPTVEAHCYHGAQNVPVSQAHQTSHCLSTNHVACHKLTATAHTKVEQTRVLSVKPSRIVALATVAMLALLIVAVSALRTNSTTAEAARLDSAVSVEPTSIPLLRATSAAVVVPPTLSPTATPVAIVVATETNVPTLEPTATVKPPATATPVQTATVAPTATLRPTSVATEKSETHVTGAPALGLQAANTSAAQVEVTVGSTSLRAEASYESAHVDYLLQGDRGTVILTKQAEGRTWYLIELESGLRGYLSDYVARDLSAQPRTAKPADAFVEVTVASTILRADASYESAAVEYMTQGERGTILESRQADGRTWYLIETEKGLRGFLSDYVAREIEFVQIQE